MLRGALAVTGVADVGSRSFWLEQTLAADAGAPCPPLRGRVSADVCIAGGGFAGLWTAYELTEREPSLDVVLLDADVCGAGGSGANGGFLLVVVDRPCLDGRWRPLGKGDVVYFPGDTVHGARNRGTVTCRIVWVFPTDTYEEIEYFDD